MFKSFVNNLGCMGEHCKATFYEETAFLSLLYFNNKMNSSK